MLTLFFGHHQRNHKESADLQPYFLQAHHKPLNTMEKSTLKRNFTVFRMFMLVFFFRGGDS